MLETYAARKKAFLLIHPPSGGVEETPEQKAALAAQEAADKANIDRITAGVTAGITAAMPKLTESMRPAPAQAAPAPRAENTLVRPSEEDIVEAIAAGNKGEATRLMKAQRAYDQQENRVALGNVTAAGGAAIGSLAKQAAERLKYYRKFKGEIDTMVDGYCTSNGAIPDFAMYERAHAIVSGNHLDDIISETTEEALRKAREPEEPLLPEGRRTATETEREPTSLAEVLAGDWKREFRVKQRETGGRTDEDELRRMGYRDGLKGFVSERKAVEKLEDETNGTFGLDRDWNKTTGTWDN